MIAGDVIEVFSSSEEEEGGGGVGPNDIIPDENDVVIYGIDPGSVNCGFCEYNATKGNAQELDTVSFREKNHFDNNGKKRSDETDMGQTKIIESVVDFLFRERERFQGRNFFIENQQQSDRKEILAVQHAFQAILGPRCIPIAPAGIKACYSDYFPKKPGTDQLTPTKRKEAQYRYDKRNAIKHGRKLVPKRVRDSYAKKHPSKSDDAYDAFFIAKFAAEWLLDEETHQKPEKRKKRKRGKTEINKRPRLSQKKKKQQQKEEEKEEKNGNKQHRKKKQ